MGSILKGAAQIFGFAIATLPLVAIPLIDLAPGEQKGSMAAFALSITCFAGAFYLLKGEVQIRLPRSIMILAGVPVVAVAGISMLGRQSFETMAYGLTLEVGTAGFFVVFAGAILTGSLLPRRDTGRLLSIFVVSVILAGASTALWYLFGYMQSGETAAGNWQQLSLLVLGALVVAVVRADTALSGARTLALLPAAILAGLFFFLSYAPAASAAILMLLAASAAILAYQRARRIPWYSIGAAVFLGALLLPGVASPLSREWPLAKPSLQITTLIIGYEYYESPRDAFLGGGPNTFARAWERFRPLALNSTPLWAITPGAGYSTFSTLAVTLGILGVLALLCIPVGLIWLFVASYVGMREETIFSRALPAFSLAIFSFVAMSLDTVGTPLMLMGALATGVTVRVLSPEVAVDLSLRSMRYVTSFVGIVLLVFGAWLMQVSARQFLAAEFYARGRAMAASQDPADPALYERAARAWGAAFYEMEASRALLTAANESAANGSPEMAGDLLERGLTLARAAANSDSVNYEVRLHEAKFYRALIETEYQGAAEEAGVSLNQAIQSAPRRPDVMYEAALLALARGDMSGAYASLRKALELKPDYEAARLLLESMQ